MADLLLLISNPGTVYKVKVSHSLEDVGTVGIKVPLYL